MCTMAVSGREKYTVLVSNPAPLHPPILLQKPNGRQRAHDCPGRGTRCDFDIGRSRLLSTGVSLRDVLGNEPAADVLPDNRCDLGHGIIISLARRHSLPHCTTAHGAIACSILWLVRHFRRWCTQNTRCDGAECRCFMCLVMMMVASGGAGPPTAMIS